MKTFTMPTAGQIEKWQKKHGTLHKITVKVPGQEDAICIVRDPLLTDIQQSSSLGEGDTFKTGKIQLDNCWLHGDDRIRSRHSLYAAAAAKMSNIFEVYPSKIETVELTPELEASFSEDLSKEILSKVKAEGFVRKVVILEGSVPVLVDEIDTRNEIVAHFQCPDLEVKEKADQIEDVLDQGTLYIQECFLSGDARFKDQSDDRISFAAYLAGLNLIERFTTEVEKL